MLTLNSVNTHSHSLRPTGKGSVSQSPKVPLPVEAPLLLDPHLSSAPQEGNPSLFREMDPQWCDWGSDTGPLCPGSTHARDTC